MAGIVRFLPFSPAAAASVGQVVYTQAAADAAVQVDGSRIILNGYSLKQNRRAALLNVRTRHFMILPPLL